MVALAPSLPRSTRRERIGGRAALLIVIVLIHLGLIAALLLARSARKAGEAAPLVVRLIPPPAAAARPKAKAAPKRVATASPVVVPRPIVDVPPPPKPAAPLFKTELFEAVDIANLPSHKAEQTADAGDGSGNGERGATGIGPSVGSGPHGEALYAAAWYREPTNAEVAPYLPKHLPAVASADIMCRTIDRFAVEDCQELGEEPRGTGLSRAIRQAGWQFKVKPVRLGQKFEVGTWVRIHYVITTEPRDAPAG